MLLGEKLRATTLLFELCEGPLCTLHLQVAIR